MDNVRHAVVPHIVVHDFVAHHPLRNHLERFAFVLYTSKPGKEKQLLAAVKTS